MFCLNMGVYRTQSGASMQPQTDQICVVTDAKMLYFFETIYTNVGCQFQQDAKFERGFQLPHKVHQIYWDDDKIYMANNKGYQILKKNTGATIGRIEWDQSKIPGARLVGVFSKDAPLPMLAAYKDKCLVVTKNNKKAKFLVEGKDLNPKHQNTENVGYLSEKPVFNLDQSRNLMQLLLVENDYVVAVYDTQVTIFNAVTGDIL